LGDERAGEDGTRLGRVATVDADHDDVVLGVEVLGEDGFHLPRGGAGGALDDARLACRRLPQRGQDGVHRAVRLLLGDGALEVGRQRSVTWTPGGTSRANDARSGEGGSFKVLVMPCWKIETSASCPNRRKHRWVSAESGRPAAAVSPFS